MITTGSKTFFGLGFAALFLAFIYGVITNGVGAGGAVVGITGNGAVDAVLGPLTLGYKGGVGEHLGYAMLLGFALANIGFGTATSFFRDADPEALAQLAGTDAPPVVLGPGANAWPFVTAVGAGIVVLGLATSSVIFVIGVIMMVVAGLEWTIAAWADAASGDPEVNRIVRSRLMLPLEAVGGSLLLIGFVIFSVSRAFIAFPGMAAVWIALAIGGLVFGGALVISSRPHLKRSFVLGILVATAVGILAVGIIGGVKGAPHHGEGESKESGAAALIDEWPGAGF